MVVACKPGVVKVMVACKQEEVEAILVFVVAIGFEFARPALRVVAFPAPV